MGVSNRVLVVGEGATTELPEAQSVVEVAASLEEAQHRLRDEYFSHVVVGPEFLAGVSSGAPSPPCKPCEPEPFTDGERAPRMSFLEGVLANAGVCLAYLDLDFNYLWVNLTYADAVARPMEEFIGRNHFEFYPHQENEAIFQSVRDAGVRFAATEKSFEFPDHPEWGVTYWDWTLSPHRDASDTIVGLVYSLIDVTASVRARQRLEKLKDDAEERARQLEELFDTAPVGMVLFDAKPPYRVFAHNHVYQRIFDEPFRSQGLVGRYIPEYLPEAENNGIFQVFREVTETREAQTLYEFPYEGPDGKWAWWNWNLSPVCMDDEVVAFASMIVEATDLVASRKRMEDLLEQTEDSRSLLQTIVEGAPALIYARDAASVAVSQDAADATVTCVGELDLGIVMELDIAIAGALDTSKPVVVDLREAAFIDTAVIAVLAKFGKAARNMKRPFKTLVAAGTHPQTVLRLAGFEEMIFVEIDSGPTI